MTDNLEHYSPAMGYSVDRKVVDSFIDTIEKHRQRKIFRVRVIAAQAIALIAKRENRSHEWAGRQLAELLRLYYASPEGRSKYAVSVFTWLQDHRFDDSPEAWREAPDKQQKIVKDGDVVDRSQIMSPEEKRRMFEEWRQQ